MRAVELRTLADRGEPSDLHRRLSDRRRLEKGALRPGRTAWVKTTSSVSCGRSESIERTNRFPNQLAGDLMNTRASGVMPERLKGDQQDGAAPQQRPVAR